MTVRFSEAFDAAIEWVDAHRKELGETVIVRDLQGRIRLALEKAESALQSNEWETLEHELRGQLGGFSPPKGQVFLYREQMVAPAAVFQAPDLERICPGVQVLDRALVGADWMRPPLPELAPQVPRATFFGIKGGVGRSTALTLWARHLAKQNRKVLVLDLDLESPGVSSSLLPPEALPTFGVVDWFVEDLVGQADPDLLRAMVASSPLAGGTGGNIRVVPAVGTSGRLLEKLSRAYSGTFAERLGRLVDALEQQEAPDVVLIDSRAGLHDVAAVSVTRLHAWSFVFAVDSAQTWQGFRHLFEAWRARSRALAAFRDRLQFVAALVPETGADTYLASARLNAYDLCVSTLYDEAAKADLDAFSFDLKDEQAPHFACPIRWRREFQTFDPALRDALDDSQVNAAYGEFFLRAEQLVLGVRRP